MIIPLTNLMMNSKRPWRTLIKLEIFVGFLTVGVCKIMGWIDPNFTLYDQLKGLAFILTVMLFYGAFLIAVQGLGLSLRMGKLKSE